MIIFLNGSTSKNIYIESSLWKVIDCHRFIIYSWTEFILWFQMCFHITFIQIDLVIFSSSNNIALDQIGCSTVGTSIDGNKSIKFSVQMNCAGFFCLRTPKQAPWSIISTKVSKKNGISSEPLDYKLVHWTLVRFTSL